MNKLQATEKVVILDRDGTVVVDRNYLSDPADLEFLPGAVDGLRRLYRDGYRLIVITNQSGVGRGMLSLQRLHDIHQRFRTMVAEAGASIDEIYFCPHIPEDNCACRKPRLGLLLRAASELHFDPANAIVIGDKASDIEFGRDAGATTILIASEQDNTIWRNVTPDFVMADLAGAASVIQRLQSHSSNPMKESPRS